MTFAVNLMLCKLLRIARSQQIDTFSFLAAFMFLLHILGSRLLVQFLFVVVIFYKIPWVCTISTRIFCLHVFLFLIRFISLL
jgi:hypothetical protein